MSIIVHGPQGCGKTRHASQILAILNRRQGAGLTRVVDTAYESDTNFGGGDVYDLVARDPARFKAGSSLYFTDEPPPVSLTGSPGVVAFADLQEELEEATSC